MPKIRKFLICAAGHLPPDFASRLQGMDWNKWPVCGMRGPFGWFIYAHDEDGNGPGEEIPPEVMEIFAYARANDCDYVYFDEDADIIEGLPVFDPEAEAAAADAAEAYRLYEETGDERLRTVF